MTKQIVFKINIDTGKLTTDAQGFKGQTCLKETEKLLKDLNATRESRRLKAEYNEVKEGTAVGVS